MPLLGRDTSYQRMDSDNAGPAHADAVRDSWQSSEFAWHNELFDMVRQHPVSSGLAILGTSVIACGLMRYGLGKPVFPRLLESSIAATHLTTPEAAIAIKASGRIGSKWGVFVLDSDRVPTSQLMRQAKTLVPRNLAAEVELPMAANAHLERPFPLGPFSALRHVSGVRSSALGSIDIATGRFTENEIFAKGVFRQATNGEIGKYKVHQFILDYGIDAGIAFVAANGA